MKLENSKFGIFGILLLVVVMVSSCISAGLIAGQVAADAAVSSVKQKLASGEKVEDLGNGQYLITVKAPAMSLGERFKAVADATAKQNGYKTYEITSTSVSKGSDTGSEISLLTGVIVCRNKEEGQGRKDGETPPLPASPPKSPNSPPAAAK
jgi:outer membrane lipoprotein-sorting protein